MKAYVPNLAAKIVANLEAARQSVVRMGIQLLMSGKAEWDAGAEMIRAGEMAEAGPLETQGGLMMIGEGGKVEAGFAMGQLGVALSLLEML